MLALRDFKCLGQQLAPGFGWATGDFDAMIYRSVRCDVRDKQIALARLARLARLWRLSGPCGRGREH
jgi:hypothetical protein